jgi:hypothetical protein
MLEPYQEIEEFYGDLFLTYALYRILKSKKAKVIATTKPGSNIKDSEIKIYKL